MAHGKGRGSLFVIFTFTFTLIHGKSLSHLSEPQTTSDEVDEILSDQYMADQGGYFEPVNNFEYLRDDGDVSDLPNSIIQGEHVRSTEAAWDAMSPKLRCGDDLMKLQLNGPGVAQVELCRGDDAPVPLTQLPPHCGHTTVTYGGLVYATPYDGCGVVQQGGSYVMQMLWHGYPVVISCPMATSDESQTMPGHPLPGFMQIMLHHTPGSTPDTLSPTETTEPDPFPGYPQGFSHHVSWHSNYPHYRHPGAVQLTAMAPIFKPAVAPESIQQPQLHRYPQGLWPYNYPHYYHHGMPKPTAKLALTSVPTTQEPTKKPQHPGDTQMFWPYNYPHYYHHGMPKPTAKPALTIAREPTKKPKLPGGTQMFWPYNYPHYYHHGMPKPTAKPASTSVPTTITRQPTKKPRFPGYTQMFWPYNYHRGMPRPTAKPASTSVPTTIAQQPTKKPRLPGYTQMFWPYNYPHYHHGMPKLTAKPASTSVPTAIAQEPTKKPQLPGHSQKFWPYDHSHYHVHTPRNLDPIIPPITAAADCEFSDNQPPHFPLFDEKYPIAYADDLWEQKSEYDPNSFLL